MVKIDSTFITHIIKDIRYRLSLNLKNHEILCMTNKLILIFLLFLNSLLPCISQTANDKELKVLDDLLSKRGTYIDLKINRIDYLKQILETETNSDRIYNLTYQIIEEYSNFQADSAFLYIDRNRNLAKSNGKSDQLLLTEFQYIFVSAQSGLLNEAESGLRSLSSQVDSMNQDQKIEYYRLWQRLYMNLQEFSQKTHLEEKYNDMQIIYCDSILQYTPVNSEYYDLYHFRKEFGRGSYDLAREYIEKYIQKIDTLSNDAARGYYYLSEIYRAENDSVNEMKYLIQSVEADIKSAVKQNRSLRILGQILYSQGDLNRAYTYLQISLDDANFYNTRLRNTQVAEAFSIIEKEYQLYRNNQELRLKTGIVLITILFVVILLISLYLRKKRIELAYARKELIRNNKELIRINAEMARKNEELSLLTCKLKDSDRVKEKYIGHFLKLCSYYIQNISEFKKTINRKIKAGQIEDVHNMTLSNMQQVNEFKDFYNEFDKAFLNIFPHFVKDFNSLLREDQRFKLKREDVLNTELRIFALIRLGIKDSSQIAEFMNYTPVTIYSYRTKVKSRAINKNTFDEDIIHIGH